MCPEKYLSLSSKKIEKLFPENQLTFFDEVGEGQNEFNFFFGID